MVQQWRPNDWAYHCFVSPFGPLPGADDVHNFTLFDNMDDASDPHLIGFAVSPPEGENVYREWPVPKVKSWRRKRNYVLGATTVLRPSAAPVLRLSPPSARPGRCASPNCQFAVARCLSAGGGLYCCHKCQSHPGKHAASCERAPFGDAANGGGAGEWQLPQYGTLDLEVMVNVKLPIPTFLIPLTLLRWLLPKLIRLVYPVLLLLNERFASTPFSQRVADDAAGFYKSIADTLNAPGRLYAARRRRPGEPVFVI